MFDRGFGRKTVEEIVSNLKKRNLLDDYKFAKLWIESRVHTAPKGDMLLKKELKDKGISIGIIDRVMSEKKEAEDAVAREIAKKRFDKLKGLPKEKSKKRLFDFLARRGFSFDIIHDIICEFYAE